MHICWFFLGFIQLATKRYWRYNWRVMHLVHIISGLTIFAVTAVYGLKIIQYFSWNVHPDYHQLMGLAALFLVFVLAVNGILTVLMQHCYNGDKPWSDYDKARYFSNMHAYLGYFSILVGNATCMTGLINYVQKQIKQKQHTWYFIFTLPLFMLIVFFLEMKHRMRDKKGVLFFSNPKNKPSISIDEFHSWVKAGK